MGLFSALSGAGETGGSNELRMEIAKSLEHQGLTGAVWATVGPEGIATDAAGLTNARNQKPLTSDSKVQTASIVKTLIATGVLRLVTEGKLTLDTPVASLLPDIIFDNRWQSSHPVLVRHLLDHTSGLDDARLWHIFTVNAKPDAPLHSSIQPEPLQIRSRPGSRISYSNLGYTLVGMVIEQVTGERYEHYLDKHLLHPLGMHMSTFRFVSQQGPHADKALAMGHFEDGVTQPTLPLYLRPAGQFTTTAADMALFAHFLMSNGEIDGKTFISADLLSAMGKPTTTEAALAGLVDAGYGLGLNSRDRHGVIGNCHSGSTAGFKTNFCLFPEEQKAFFVAFNADVETADYKEFDALLIDQLGIQTEPTMPAAPPLENLIDWQGIYVLAPSRIESFAYVDLLLHFATVGWDGQYLHLKPFQSKSRALAPVGGPLFRAEDRTHASHALIVSDDGKRIISDGFRSYEQTSLWRMVPLWGSLVAGVLGLIWLLISGVVCMLRRRLKPSSALYAPFISSVALLLPIPLFFSQSFLQLGDLTPASALLTVVTGMLPLAMMFGLWRSFSRQKIEGKTLCDALAMLGVLQWCLVLAVWGLLPLRLWG
ncbi:hypothetical protein AT746_19415 [Lacimicrobium alkaliphilum]|uniref:Beta-lactamase-related domain-containing protein n=2 Tax=Lacimicrobium alkaliphilum TaxID=1526571 RepID=A0A0U2RS53_9ALTE|nr:hypothetical protein AT746_19415 [Lacimicrobium alkaliphilum]